MTLSDRSLGKYQSQATDPHVKTNLQAILEIIRDYPDIHTEVQEQSLNFEEKAITNFVGMTER